jgi:hypothetical protein
MIATADLCAVTEATCRVIASRDLGDTPVYIVPQSRLQADLAGPSRCEGYTTGSLDLYCREAIGAEWRGRGACMVINDTDIGSMDPDDIELYFQVVAIHELAHILERPALYHDRLPTDQAALQGEAADIAKRIAADALPVEDVVPFLGHGARFIRAALHLCHRAQAAGVPVAPAQVCAGSNYGLSHATCYRDALGTEFGWSAGDRMLNILRRPAPKAFSQLWTADVVHWFTFCPIHGERLFS